MKLFRRRQQMFVLIAAMIPSACVATDPLVIERVFVKRIAEVDLAAPKAGLVADVFVGEGAAVTEDDPLAKLDDRNAEIDVQRAEIELDVARQKVQDRWEIQLAEKRLQVAQQSSKQSKIENDAAHRQAENRLGVQAAEKSSAVAKNELDRARRARAEYADSVSESEIEGLSLTFQKAELESQQAEFQRQQDLLSAQASDQALETDRLTNEQLQIELQQAHSELRLAQFNANLFQNALDAARLDLAQHRIHAPFAGVVVELYRQRGEWVKPGDPILRVLRLDRLRVEGFLPTQLLSGDLVGAQAEIEIVGFEKQSIPLAGKVSFVSPEVDAVNNEVAIWAEFDNPDRLVWPGMQGVMKIRLPDAKTEETKTDETNATAP